jgi:glycerophosphoryl diester phosphodiesterase
MTKPLVIAHRGASGYLPEHTLEAKALAHEMGADYLEQDVVATRDDELVVMHDVTLDDVTDVAERFPGRARADGRYYVRDFDLTELRGLHVWERMNPDGTPVYPGRYPARTGDFHVHTFAEEIDFIRGLNAKSGREAGIYPEIKRPAWHREQGIDVTPGFLEVLSRAGYARHDDRVFVQCFDDAELRRIRHDLGCRLKLVQLIGENDWHEAATDYDAMQTADGLERLARTVNAIGPWVQQLYELAAGQARPVDTGLVGRAHAAGLAVHPYTFRVDDLPPGFDCFEDLVRYTVTELGVDGLFTDFPDRVSSLRLP